VIGLSLGLVLKARAELGIVPWSEWASTDSGRERVRVERHTGPRADLRALFEEAEDSGRRLDAYIDAGEVLTAIKTGRVVGHLQLIDNPAAEASEIKNMAVEPDHRGPLRDRVWLDLHFDAPSRGPGGNP
jgi:hypothetical protein